MSIDIDAIQRKSDTKDLNELKRLLPLRNTDRPGVDSTKRKLAIELLVGPADGWQTDRLARLAIAMNASKSGMPS